MSSAALSRPHRSKRRPLRGCDLDLLSQGELIEELREAWQRDDGGWILTVNVDILRQLSRECSFRTLAEGATFRVIDGTPLVWLSRLLGWGVVQRLAGSDLLSVLSRVAADEGKTIALIGGNRYAAAEAAARLLAENPHLDIAYVESPPCGFERDVDYMDRLRNELAEAAPRLVFVGLGSPKQDLLINVLREGLPKTWFIGVGIAFSFASGEIRRAPRWMQVGGLEWLHRLAQEPRRLGGRYLIADLPFFAWLTVGSIAGRCVRALLPGRRSA